MKYLSLFSGIGGFEIGIERAFSVRNGQTKNTRTSTLEPSMEPASESLQSNGYRTDPEFGRNTRQVSCVGYSEIDKYAIKVYERHFNHENYGDITAIKPDRLPDFDFVVGGFPCQSFSIAGKRAGFNDTRGTLFFDIARILKVKRPRHLLLENVKGLLSHDNGQTFRTILGVLADLGYRVEWQVLNSKYHRVPQNRERVFIIGHLRGECGSKVFPIGQVNSSLIEQPQSRVQEGEVAQTVTATYHKGGKGSHISERQDSRQEQAKPDADNTNRRPTYSIGSTQQNAGVMKETSTALTEAMGQGGGHVPMVSRQPLRYLNRNQKKIEGDYAFTVDASQTSGIKQDQRIRRLTPKECERLQGFPDDWTAGESDTQRYKMCGNAVTVNVIRDIMENFKCLA